MSLENSTVNRGFYPFLEPATMKRGFGAQFDWDKVGNYYNRGGFIVKSNGGAAKAATSVPIDALEKKLPMGTVLDFGAVDGGTVTASANASTSATSISVNALAFAIPSGTILDFGTSKQVKLTSAAAVGDTSIAVAALDTAIVSGNTATYQGGRKLAKLTQAEEVGATSLHVEKLQFAIADNDEARADTTDADGKLIPIGTMICQQSNGLWIPARDRQNSEEVEALLGSDADQSLQNAKNGFGTVIGNTVVWENLLPDYGASGYSGWKTQLQSNSLGFVFKTWSDNTIS